VDREVICRSVSDSLALLKVAVAGRYTIEQELGRGGMATVFLAQDLKHQRLVAVKLLRAELAGAIGPERFLREIEIAARLSHPHILPLFDSGNANGLLFYVMPYIEGESLRQRLDRERMLPIPDAIRITREVGEALDYAHSQGFVHRDIKPENILLSQQHAVLADFGIARAAAAAGTEKLTETGLTLGTPSYMSPEQAAGDDELDGRSDQYSLGCVLYEMVVGEPPFSGRSPQHVLARHVMDPVPPPRTVRPAVTAALESVLLRALAKSPVDRYDTMRQFVEALETPAGTGPEMITLVRPVPPTRSIAVLPFVNLSGDPDNEYFGDGLAEELLNLLGGIAGLRVASRTSAFVFKGVKTDLRTIGQALNVQHVLEGTVRKAGNRIRVSVQLTSASDGFDLWSERYDRELKDVFGIQDEIARTIMSALQIRLSGEQAERLAKRGTVDPEAYDLYLKGRHHWNNRPAGIFKAVEYFKQAIAKDPGYALAYTGLADCYGSIGGWLAHVHLHYDWNWPAAEREFGRAVELHPTYSTAHHWLSHLAMATGRPELSLVESRRCLELDPVDLVINVHLIWHYWLAHQPDEAIEQGHKTLELHPHAFWPEFFMGLAYELKQMPEIAASHLEKAATMSGGASFVLAALGHACAKAGNSARAQELLRVLQTQEQERYVPAYDRAIIYLGLNETDIALDWLQRAYQERSSWISYLNVEPRLESLRNDPRFLELARQLGGGSLQPQP
jgi:eukaryotic-like serine/threonine-protein kinase